MNAEEKINVSILNCNNIDSGKIDIIKGRLNIKYAINGTGKSTIARAIECASSPDNLKYLTPYKYLKESPTIDNHLPKVDTSEHINNVAIFNEDYVNKYTFLQTDLLSNSFEIFIKTADYDTQMSKIQILIQEIQTAFSSNPELDELINDLSQFIDGFGKAKNGYSKTGSIGKGIAKGNKIVNIPQPLEKYAPYIQSTKNIDWVIWQSKGEEYLDFAETCPYCTNKLLDEQKSIIRQVSVEYDSKYLTELQKMTDNFKKLNNYFTDKTKEEVNKLKNSCREYSIEEINFLKEIKIQVDTLHEKLLQIRLLNFTTLKDVDGILLELQTKKINISLLSHINSEYTNNKISPVNNALDNIIKKASHLQGEINKQKDIIKRTIESNKKDINYFLKSAGYNYEVSIIEDPEHTYKMILISTDGKKPIDDVRLHLSYGERNAFALVLFMYHTLKEKPDIIILDDPISSFDNNKKYAIMEMLFKGSKSFQGKTVIMLTHDFDPVIDLIYTPSIRCRFNPNPVSSFIYNVNGKICEKEIKPDSIQSFIEVANTNIQSNIDEINKLIYLRRRLEACGDKGIAWQLLSNIFHPDRKTPKIRSDGCERDMTSQEIRCATEIIRKEIQEFDYDRIYERAHNVSEMINLYDTVTSNYEKVQIYRIINYGNINDTVLKKFVDESYHVENDNLFQLNPSEYPIIPDYIVRLCDNGIELIRTAQKMD